MSEAAAACYLRLEPVAETDAQAPAAVVRLLADGGATEDQLADLALADGGPERVAEFYLALSHWKRRNRIWYELRLDGELLATMRPVRGDFAFQPLALEKGRAYTLSRFALLRREGDWMVLESPLAAARAWLEPRAAGAGFAALGAPVTDEPRIRSLLEWLLQAGLLESADGAEPPELAMWEFHDLHFHCNSRLGRAPGRIGATYRFRDRIGPLPAAKSAMSSEKVSLYRPDMERLAREDAPLTLVLEGRRSRRGPGNRRLTSAQLGEFLYRTAHVREVWPGEFQELARGPMPSGGALHELEVYVTVNACEDLPRGLYHYHAHEHALYRLPAAADLVQQLLDGAAAAWGNAWPAPEVLLTLASRFERIAWKYEGMAYRTTLLDAGAALQTLYLAATAMGLAPCALGNGDSDLFAAAAGLNPWAEAAVAEFALSGG